MTNDRIADRLDEVAATLGEQQANPFRVCAWRNAAGFIRQLPISVAHLYGDEGVQGLERIRNIGPSIAGAIRDLLTLGRLPLLERLRGEAEPESGMETRTARAGPSVEELLEVDREYRRRARKGELPLITPRRFNPDHRAWLPVLHTSRGDRHYTALYSNTLLAHKLGRTHDWVVLYSDGDREEHQATVVTAWSGPFRGRRVVRGRELECEAWYARHQRAAGRCAGLGA